MNLSKTTLRQIVKTLSDFSELASKQESTRQKNKARLAKLLIKKINKNNELL